MVRDIVNNAEVLTALLQMKPKERLDVLQQADEDLVRCLCACALNVIKGNVTVNSAHKKKLSPHKHLLRALVLRKGGWKHKKKILLQKGGNFIPLLLGPILSAVLSSVLT